MLPLNEYESKSRTSLAYSVSGESEDHVNNRLNSAGGATSRRLNHNNVSTGTSFAEGLRGDAIYFPSPYALSRVVSVYESSGAASDLVKGCTRQHQQQHPQSQQQQSQPHTPSHNLIPTPVHRQHQQHYDVPFKQASRSLCTAVTY